jgi:hypothetical protein
MATDGVNRSRAERLRCAPLRPRESQRSSTLTATRHGDPAVPDLPGYAGCRISDTVLIGE